ncbi:hypothetical protein LTR95_000627 [Oleoguttula sp. CCFEE 5521]
MATSTTTRSVLTSDLKTLTESAMPERSMVKIVLPLLLVRRLQARSQYTYARRDITRPRQMQHAAFVNKQLWHDYYQIAKRDAVPIVDRLHYNAALDESRDLCHEHAFTTKEAILKVQLVVPTWLEDQGSDEDYYDDENSGDELGFVSQDRRISFPPEKLREFARKFDFMRILITVAIEFNISATGKRVAKAVSKYVTGKRDGWALLEFSVRVDMGYGVHAYRDTNSSPWVGAGRVMKYNGMAKKGKVFGEELESRMKARERFLERWQV